MDQKEGKENGEKQAKDKKDHVKKGYKGKTKDKEEKRPKHLTKEEVKQLEGNFDDDGFYILKEGGFYDPLGNYYNKDGCDEEGGHYDKGGFYVKPNAKKERGPPEHNDKKKPLPRYLIEQFRGHYDRDGFYLLKQGGFYDTEKMYFNKEGLDAFGGRYNKKGFYVKPSKHSGKLTKKEIEKLDGKYDDDDFYNLKGGGFYDTQGVYFDKDGFDEVGGFYDEEGYYVKPEVKEEKEFR